MVIGCSEHRQLIGEVASGEVIRRGLSAGLVGRASGREGFCRRGMWARGGTPL